MTSSKYGFLNDYVGLNLSINVGLDLYSALSDSFLPKIGDAQDENNRAEAGRLAYRVMRGLHDKGIDYHAILEKATELAILSDQKIKLTMKDGSKKVVKL